MNTTEKLFDQIRKKLDKGLERNSQDFIYINKESLYEHFKAASGMSRVPVGISESTDASASAGILGIRIGASAGETTSFELSEPHLFEALEHYLREKYSDVTNEADIISNLQRFVWLKGRLYWVRVGPTPLKGGEIEDRTFLMLEIGDIPLNVACDKNSFSPFMPFLYKDSNHFNIEMNVEIFGFNTGALNHYSVQAHPKSGKSLVIVPTVILAGDEKSREELAENLRQFEKLKLY